MSALPPSSVYGKPSPSPRSSSRDPHDDPRLVPVPHQVPVTESLAQYDESMPIPRVSTSTAPAAASPSINTYSSGVIDSNIRALIDAIKIFKKTLSALYLSRSMNAILPVVQETEKIVKAAHETQVQTHTMFPALEKTQNTVKSISNEENVSCTEKLDTPQVNQDETLEKFDTLDEETAEEQTSTTTSIQSIVTPSNHYDLELASKPVSLPHPTYNEHQNECKLEVEREYDKLRLSPSVKPLQDPKHCPIISENPFGTYIDTSNIDDIENTKLELISPPTIDLSKVP